MTTMLFGLIVSVLATVALVWIALTMVLTFAWHDSYRPYTGPLWVPPVYRARCQRTRDPRPRFDGVPHHAQLLLAQWTPLPEGQTYGQPTRALAAA